MKIIIRNLISIIRRFKAAWLMNFAGITAALTALMFVGMQISYENSFDANHQNADRIYNVYQDIERPFNVIIERSNIELFGTLSPKVEAYSAVMDFDEKNYVETNNNGEKNGFYEYVIGIDSGFVKMFTFEITNGNPASLNLAGNAMICESLAKKFFGTTDIIGKQITINESWCAGNGTLTITAVYKDFDSNTQTKNCIYFILDDTAKQGNYGRNFLCYVMLSSPNDKQEIETLFNQKVKQDGGENTPYQLDPLYNVYYHNENSENFIKSGSAKNTTMLTIIALIVLLIAAINQTNFNIALIPKRIKSINIQKVIGCSTVQLRKQLYIEMIIIVLSTWLAALLMVKLLGGTWVTSFLVPDNLSISSNFGICLLVGLISLIINTLSNIYTINKLTSTNPALVLKGSFGRSTSGRKMRYSLLVFQFFSAICFISIAVSIWLQIKHLENSNTILDQNQIVTFKINENFGSKFDLAKQRLTENSAIDKIAACSQLIGGSDSFNAMGFVWKATDTLYYNIIDCAGDITGVFNISIIKGKGFGDIYNSDIGNYNWKNDCIITSDLADEHNIHLGDTITGAVTGIIEQGIRITSYRMKNNPLMFRLSKADYLKYCNVRITKGSNVKEAIDHITKVVSEIAPELPLEIEFYDQIFQKLYEKEIKTSATTVFMAILAILISIIGVFGMVTFDAEYKRQEIAIRKVFGANNSNIITSVNLKYIKIVSIGFILSLPVTHYVIINWQQSFVEKVSLPWWMFAIILAGVLLITITIVTAQSLKAIFQNPVDGIKTE
ncbi:MAG: ABC transporter permease [Bacteroidales bacterium]|nr:ABC transporter permease [Bacteroidales bacterium]